MLFPRQEAPCEIVVVQTTHDQDDFPARLEARQRRRLIVLIDPVPHRLASRFRRLHRVLDHEQVRPAAVHGAAEANGCHAPPHSAIVHSPAACRV